MSDETDTTSLPPNSGSKKSVWAWIAVLIVVVIVVIAILFIVGGSSDEAPDDEAPGAGEEEEVEGEEGKEEEEKEEEEQPPAPDDEEEQPPAPEEEEVEVLEELNYLINHTQELEGTNIHMRTAPFFDHSIHEITESKVFHSLSLRFRRELKRSTDPQLECLWYDLRAADDSPIGVTLPVCDYDAWESDDVCSQNILYDFTQQPGFDVYANDVSITIDRLTPNAAAFFDELKANRKLRLYIRISGDYTVIVKEFHVQIYYIV